MSHSITPQPSESLNNNLFMNVDSQKVRARLSLGYSYRNRWCRPYTSRFWQEASPPVRQNGAAERPVWDTHEAFSPLDPVTAPRPNRLFKTVETTRPRKYPWSVIDSQNWAREKYRASLALAHTAGDASVMPCYPSCAVDRRSQRYQSLTTRAWPVRGSCRRLEVARE
jgi:hypothetical protein